MKYTELPQSFLDEMNQLLGEEYPSYLESFAQPWNRSLRVNEQKLLPGNLASLLAERSGQKLEPVPWISNGFYYDSQWTASKDPYYFAGLYYLQEPSAMTPASRLPIEPGDMVLDLCAAPGGKSTELGARLKGRGMLFANDISSSRAKALLKNLELFGIPNICVTSETPEKLAECLPEFFDKILVDAPCSGEGMFRKEPDMVKDWVEKGPSYYAPIQQAILQQAVRLLKPGGYLLYSTCTFSRMEDEENVIALMKSCPEMELVPLEHFAGAADGFGLSGVLRLFPHKVRGEGHFLALLRKALRSTGSRMKDAAEGFNKNNAKGKGRHASASQPSRSSQELGDFPEFFRQLSVSFPLSQIRRIQDSIYYLPEQFPEGLRLRYLRTGLLLGELKRERFEPSQPLAMALKPEQFSNAIHFPHDDQRVIRYLKGETIALTEGEEPRKGWCLVCVEDFPLGWAKASGMTLKNKYYPGWRYQ
ncbi:MAG: RsmB/NOP family class I SAM-dependent RNA methyltransferase [Lachnospiraceae bacterium]|nr:RsmB/NOP family class I SAM-dependent RNA methyltransferase [Lachnospiraceae bacterium]